MFGLTWQLSQVTFRFEKKKEKYIIFLWKFGKNMLFFGNKHRSEHRLFTNFHFPKVGKGWKEETLLVKKQWVMPFYEV